MTVVAEPRVDGAEEIRPTIVEFVLDETGSMDRLKAATIAGYNSFISDQKQQAGQCLFTLSKFDSTDVFTPFTDLDLSMVVPMTSDTFCPRGGTNLYDTMGDRVRNLENRLSKWTIQPNVLMIVMTDGEDNASKRYDPAQIKDMIKAHEAQGWSFVFLSATANGKRTGEKLGFQEGNIKQFDTSRMEETMSTLSKATTAYRSTMSCRASTQSSSDYFND